MVPSARFKFAATLVVSVLAVVLTLVVGGEGDGGETPARVASQLPASPR